MKTLLKRPGQLRKLVPQIALIAFIIFLFAAIGINYYTNITQRNIGIGFSFLNHSAGFSISQTLIPYTESDTFGRTFFVGLLNTLLASFWAIVLACILGFVIGLMRLSVNPLFQKISLGYIELLRNIPPLLHVLFWYQVVFLRVLPDVKQSMVFFNSVYLNVRGITLPEFHPSAGYPITLGIFLLGIVAIIGLGFYRRALRLQGVERKLWPFQLVCLLIVILAIPVFKPYSIVLPELGKFGFTKGTTLRPELFSIVFALGTYTSTYLAEIVRSSVEAVPKGQLEAAMSLGFSPSLRMRLVVIPQALRTMIPPATNQFLNIIKNSSLGVAIAYPDLTAVFAGTTLNQTGRALEVMLMVMFTYLAISLVTSGLMNLYNKKILNPQGQRVEVENAEDE